MFSQHLVATCSNCTLSSCNQPLLQASNLHLSSFFLASSRSKDQQQWQGRCSVRSRRERCHATVPPRAALGDSNTDSAVPEGSSPSQMQTAERVPGGESTKQGARIFDFLFIFGGLLDRPFGDGESIAATGGVVVEQAKREAEELMSKGVVDKQVYFELVRALQLLSMDLKLVAAARKDSTLFERLDAAKVNLKLALRMADLL